MRRTASGCGDRADAGLGQAVDRRVGVLGRVVHVRPVEERRNATVDGFERAHQVRDVDVLGAVLDADVVEHAGEVLIERAARQHAAHGRLPGVAVRVDEARHHDAIACVDDVRVRARLKILADRDDLGALDQHVRVRHVAELGVEREHVATLDQSGVICVEASADHVFRLRRRRCGRRYRSLLFGKRRPPVRRPALLWHPSTGS
jgi:hypothetical protein